MLTAAPLPSITFISPRYHRWAGPESHPRRSVLPRPEYADKPTSETRPAFLGSRKCKIREAPIKDSNPYRLRLGSDQVAFWWRTTERVPRYGTQIQACCTRMFSALDSVLSACQNRRARSTSDPLLPDSILVLSMEPERKAPLPQRLILRPSAFPVLLRALPSQSSPVPAT